MLRAGKDAGFGAAEDTVAVAGDEAVSPVAEGLGQELEEKSEELPEAAELMQDEDDRVGAREEMFAGEFVIHDDVDGVEILGISAATGQDAGG